MNNSELKDYVVLENTERDFKRIQTIENELKLFDAKVKENRKLRYELDTELKRLSDEEQKIRSELIFLRGLLSNHSWCYESGARLSGWYDNYPLLSEALGRFDDHHVYFELEKGIELNVCDSFLYINFEAEMVFKPGTKMRDLELEKEKLRNKMRNFIKRWSITLETEQLESRREDTAASLEQIECLLLDLKELQAT